MAFKPRQSQRTFEGTIHWEDSSMPKTHIEVKRVNRLYADLQRCPEISEVKWFDLENPQDILIRIERDTVVTIHFSKLLPPNCFVWF